MHECRKVHTYICNVCGIARVFAGMHVCTLVCLYVCMYIMHLYMCFNNAYKHDCMDVSMYVCVRVLMYVCVYSDT